jgi:hypothetical protein
MNVNVADITDNLLHHIISFLYDGNRSSLALGPEGTHIVRVSDRRAIMQELRDTMKLATPGHCTFDMGISCY